LTLGTLNGSLAEDKFFIPLAIAMLLGYSTVGALLASRTPGNPIGWLMMTIGGAFILSGLSDEYATYAYITNPGSLPAPVASAWASSITWPVIFAALPFLGLLFPDGRVPGARWRSLVPATIACGVVAVASSALAPGPIEDAPIHVRNPLGVEALSFLGPVAAAAWIGLVIAQTLGIAAVVVRYRRSAGEERQQIRWLAYVAVMIAAVVVLAVAAAIVWALVGASFGESVLGELPFYLGFGLVGVGVPAAMGIAILKYRLYDLDLVIKKTVVFAILVVLLMAAGGILLVIPGALIGLPTDEPGLILLVGATLGALLIPLYRLAARIADRVVYGGRAKPYEVLTEFSGRLAETYSSDDILPRTAAILAEGTGAERVTIWLLVGGEAVPASTWPADANGPAPGPDAFQVRHQGELLGSITVTMPHNDPMTPSKERLIRDLAGQAGLVLRNVRLIEELRASRRRLVAAQDEERRRLERNIHDGAQQQLVALSVQLRLVEQLVDRDATKAHEVLRQLQRTTGDALEDLRDLARGIYPPLLADQGLPAALEAQARKSGLPITLAPDGVGRYDQDVEAAVYFCVLEALQNVAKYARATAITVTLHDADRRLLFEVNDDGEGFDPAHAVGGMGLRSMSDRVEAVGGSLEVTSTPGRGTTVVGTIPLR